jgi:hypothetical protein
MARTGKARNDVFEGYFELSFAEPHSKRLVAVDGVPIPFAVFELADGCTVLRGIRAEVSIAVATVDCEITGLTSLDPEADPGEEYGV